MSEERRIFTLAQLNQSLENHFFKHFSQHEYWITAEVVKVNQKNQHWYLELADSSNEQTTARSKATIWASVYQTIATTIGHRDLQGILQPGNRILMNVKIEFHKIYGLSLKIRDIDPNYSYGEIERRRQEVIKRLKKENLFDRQQQLRLPVILKRIALIGSPKTSGYRDFLNELFNNHDFTNFKIREFPVRVQGEAAVDEIVKAIQEANQYDAEVIVLLRGGGSKMDLALFDDYKIAVEICNSRLPVLTGIGHETDEVVADLVAKQFFITPTAVGQFIQYEIQSFRQIMRELSDKTIHLAQQLLSQSKDEFTVYNNYLLYNSRELIHSWKIIFQDFEHDIYEKSRTLLFSIKEELNRTSHLTSIQLHRLTQQERDTLERYLDRISSLSKIRFDRERDLTLNQFMDTIRMMGLQVIENARITLKNQEELLTLLNPLKIVASGYTISTIKDQDLNKSSVNIGDEMVTLSKDYLLTSKITKIEKNKNEN